MAWTSVAGHIFTLGNVADKTAGTSIVGTLAATAAVGSVLIVYIGTDNVQTTDGNTNEITSVTDSAGGNTWIKAREFCNGQAAAAGGATVAVYYSQLKTQIAASGTITANFSSTVTASAMDGQKYSIAAGSGVAIAGTPVDLATDAANPGSMTISGLTNAPYLFFRASALESPTIFTGSDTTNWTGAGGAATTGGGSATNIGAQAEFRILTATGATSAPAAWATCDSASVLIAFSEASFPAYSWVPRLGPILAQ